MCIALTRIKNLIISLLIHLNNQPENSTEQYVLIWYAPELSKLPVHFGTSDITY